jgi:hypothetical protein
VVRDGIEGFVVQSRDVEALARRMEQLGEAPQLRARMAAAARSRALEFDWPRYHDAVAVEVVDLISQPRPRPTRNQEMVAVSLSTPAVESPEDVA